MQHNFKNIKESSKLTDFTVSDNLLTVNSEIIA